MKISAELLQKIKEANNILEVVGEFVVLRKSGANFVGLCPFHSERSPSFSVSERKQLFHCYGCKKGGDTLTFLMEMGGLSFPQAIKELAERGRVQLPKEALDALKTDGAHAERREEQETAFRLNRFASTFFHQNYLKSESAQKYVRGRGLSPDAEKRFYVGYASGEWDQLVRHLEASKAPLDLAEKLGLIRKGQQGKVFDLFRSRVLFPILDLRGRVLGFGGRLFGEVDQPKYLNSPESPLFHKSKVLFGLFQAQKYIREENAVIIVEGYFDAIALSEAGFKNVVATCGTALTQEHLSLLKRFAQKLILLFDQDEAGISATERSMELALETGTVLYSVSLPSANQAKDPDEFLFKNGVLNPEAVQQFKMALEESQPILDRRIEAWVRESAKGPEAKSQAIKNIARWFSLFKDPIGVRVRSDSTARMLGVSEALLLPKGVAGEPPRPYIQPQAQTRPQPRMMAQAGGASEPSILDVALLEGVVTHLEKLNELRQKITTFGGKMPPGHEMTLFDDPGLENWWQQVKANPSGSLDAGTAIAWLGSPRLKSHLTEVLVAEDKETGAKNEFSESIEQIREQKLTQVLDRLLAKKWARFSQTIKQRLSAAEASRNADLQAELMQQYLDVQRKMKEFNGFYDEG